MIRFTKTELSNASKTIRASVKDGKGLPKSISLHDSNGKIRNLKVTEYLGLFQQKNIFILRNGREPNYVTFATKCSTLPVAMNYQDTGYTCGPTSLSMASMCLLGYTSESTFAKACHTTTGTTPDNLISGAKKQGYKVTRIGRNYESVYKSLSKGKPVIAHIQTAPATCLGFKGDYGHYVLIYWCKNKEYFIADPTKGMHKCKATILDKATNGRDIGYYEVKPL